MILTIAAAKDNACVLHSLQNLFKEFSTKFDAFLFRNIRDNLNRDYIIKHQQEEIFTLGYERYYTSHSFRMRVATLARLEQLSEDKILLFRR